MYISKERVKEELEISGSSDDALINMLIAEAQQVIESETGRKFEASADSTMTLDAIADVHGSDLWLPYDLCAITSVTNGDSTTVSSSEYVTSPRNETPYYKLTIRSDADIAWTYSDYPENAISIVGRWAYSKIPPFDIVRCMVRLVGYYLQQRKTGDYDVLVFPDAGVVKKPVGIPSDVERLLVRYRR